MKTLRMIMPVVLGAMVLSGPLAYAQTSNVRNATFKHFGQTKTYAWPGAWGKDFTITFNKDGTFTANTGNGTWVAKSETEACLTYAGVAPRCDTYP